MSSHIMDEYKEELNEFVSFGILYTHRAMSEKFISDELSPREERDIMAIMKLSAIRAIKLELEAEYDRIKSEYDVDETKYIEVKEI